MLGVRSAKALQNEKPTPCLSGQVHHGIFCDILIQGIIKLSLIRKNLRILCLLIGTTAEWNTQLSTFFIRVFGINFFLILGWLMRANRTLKELLTDLFSLLVE